MVRRRASWALVLLLISVMSGSVAAQSNLLKNPGFEDGFVTVSAGRVASNWTPWNAARTEEMPSYQNEQPVYLAASEANAQGVFSRTRNGSNAQVYYSFYVTHDGGVYQQVSGITPGTELRFSIYAYVWSSRFDDVNVSDEPGDVAVRVGIDPTGGTDPFAASVIYTDAQIFYDAFRQYSVTTTAQASSVTVFVRSTVGEPVQGSYVYLDDALLEVTSATVPVVSTDTPAAVTNTVVPTNTSVPATSTSAPQSTVVVATDTPSVDSTPTSEVVTTSFPTATSFVVATATPTGTSVPSTGGPGPISEEFPGTIIHVVRSGDVVFNLARLYGSSVDAIIAANGLNSNGFIRQGQQLIIPVRIAPVRETPSPLTPTATPLTGGGTGGPVGTANYTVQPGDSLSGIAQRFNTTLNALAQLNGITNPNRIFVGQRLIVPSAGGTGGPNTVPTSPAVPTTQPPVVITVPVIITATPVAGTTPSRYVVQPGDNLYRISVRFDVSMIELARANNITNYNLVFAGSTLVIPQ